MSSCENLAPFDTTVPYDTIEEEDFPWPLITL